MKKYPKVSIIIPLYIKTPYFFESVEQCLKLDYPDFEILIGVDANNTDLKFDDPRIKILKTGELRTGPAEKRDIGIVKATGEVIAFLDDDSYPHRDWLKKGMEILQEKNVAAVCGPGLTPPKDTFAQQVTGGILSSIFASGPYYYRFVKGTPQYVDDYPAYNMLVKKDVLIRVGGFGTKFYGGEDTAVCIKLINAGEKIYYHPDIVVYHHRRKFPMEYIRQVGNVGLHRGYFVKTFPQTSLRLSYFMPSFFTILLPIILLISVLDYQVMITFIFLSVLVYILIFMESFYKNNLIINFILPFAVVVNHLAYGIQFLKGLFLIKKLER